MRVSTASPATSTASSGRKRETWPAVCPGPPPPPPPRPPGSSPRLSVEDLVHLHRRRGRARAPVDALDRLHELGGGAAARQERGAVGALLVRLGGGVGH